MTEKYAARLDDANWRKYFERVEAIPLKERSAPVTAEYEKNRATWESYLTQQEPTFADLSEEVLPGLM